MSLNSSASMIRHQTLPVSTHASPPPPLIALVSEETYA